MSHIYNSARVRVIALNIRKVNRTEMPLPIRLNEYNSTISLLYLFSLVFPLCFSMEMTLVEHVLECGAASTLLIIYIEKKTHIHSVCTTNAMQLWNDTCTYLLSYENRIHIAIKTQRTAPASFIRKKEKKMKPIRS